MLEPKLLGNFEIHEKKGKVKIYINQKFFSLDIIYSVSYLFTNNYYVLIDGDPKDEIFVEIKPKKPGKEPLEQIGRKFNNELINYSSYFIQKEHNKKMRDEIFKRVMITNFNG